MDFLSRLFGSGSNDNDCCNQKLKKHLKECAGMGQLPPLQRGCSPCAAPQKTNDCAVEDPCMKKADACADPCTKQVDPCAKQADSCARQADPCAKQADPCASKCECDDPMTSLAGPPTCKGCTRDLPVCCPPPRVRIKVFTPNPVIPETLKFCCPESGPCCPPIEKPLCKEKASVCCCPKSNCPIIEVPNCKQKNSSKCSSCSGSK